MISAKPPALTRGRTPESLALRPAWLGPRPGPHPSPECMGTGLWRRTGLQSLEGDLGFRPDWLCAPGRLVPALRLCFPFMAKHGQCSRLPTSQAVTGAGEMPTRPLAARGTASWAGQCSRRSKRDVTHGHRALPETQVPLSRHTDLCHFISMATPWGGFSRPPHVQTGSCDTCPGDGPSVSEWGGPLRTRPGRPLSRWCTLPRRAAQVGLAARCESRSPEHAQKRRRGVASRLDCAVGRRLA